MGPVLVIGVMFLRVVKSRGAVNQEYIDLLGKMTAVFVFTNA